jgi:hypothetical protein
MTHESGAETAATVPTPVEHPQATVTKSRGVSHSTRETAVSPAPASRELVSGALLWACAFLVAFAVLAARTQPTLAFLAMTGVITLLVIREVVR